ncbi:flagellar brake protein [Rugamonas sp. CCM 8940]|uniref:flagellar brake protein n=1 Tax=Rugamonas sp. CCM 8940 TaxID=2765359 RepID=UPI0018F291D3|nr:flagellar brake protein [Rugamonas sp. CCM 8940]MBJ7311715.1 flagellar brake protein [Rugamonas sp. CCM 8940]
MLINEHTAVPIRKGPPRPQDAIAPIPAAASSHEMTSEDEIGDTLTLLAASGDAISMYVSGTREAVLGRILSVDPDLPHFVIELNEGATLTPGKITFVAVLRTAKLQFRLSNMDWNSVPGSPQLIPMVFPEVCLVLDRRSSERVETPLGTNFTASLETHGTFYEWSVYDFSLGGIGLRCSKSEAKGLLKGRKLPDVQLELGEETVLVTELEIRFTRAFRSFLLGEQIHIGCTFSNMTPEVESQIKSLMDQLDHAHRQR